jgi:hypothetical protein
MKCSFTTKDREGLKEYIDTVEAEENAESVPSEIMLLAVEDQIANLDRRDPTPDSFNGQDMRFLMGQADLLRMNDSCAEMDKHVALRLLSDALASIKDPPPKIEPVEPNATE